MTSLRILARNIIFLIQFMLHGNSCSAWSISTQTPSSTTLHSHLQSSSYSSPDNTIVITHAAGRIGKLIALQIQKDAALRGKPKPHIRAIVRTEQEALSLQCELGGMTMVGEKLSPITLDWLETIVVENLSNKKDLDVLRQAFQGAGAAVFSQNEMVWENSSFDDDDDDDDIFDFYFPAAENNNLSKRLLAEIEAAASSTTLSHVVLRSSMGLASEPYTDASIAMGGEISLSGSRKAEEKLKKTNLNYTILRLGALTEDSAMVPLLFGQQDAILKKIVDGTSAQRPPIISHADAARVSSFLLQEPQAFHKMTVDCSWHPNFDCNGLGTKEARFAAARQDLKKEIINECCAENIFQRI